jgi:N-acylneuraminate cytidylyltransferase
LNSRYINKVVIDTDSIRIAKNARENFGDKVQIINRPPNIQGDFVSMNTIIGFDLQKLNQNIHFLQTHSTNPLLSTDTINRAIENYFNMIERKIYDSLFSVTRFQTRLYWQNGVPVNHDPNELIRTQDLPVVYEENSNFYIFSRDSFQNNGGKRIGKKPYLYEIDKIEAIDIDEPDDFIIAEQLYKLKNNE